MKKIITTTAALALAVTGIATAAPAQATPSQYVSWIKSEIDGSQYLTNAQIIKMGRMICTSIDKGIDTYEIGKISMDAGYTMEEAAAWVVGAVYFICPRNKWALS